MNDERADLLRRLPPVNDVLAHADVARLVGDVGRRATVEFIRSELDRLRADGGVEGSRQTILARIAEAVLERANRDRMVRLGPVVNATGVVLHTGLGRAPLSDRALDAVRSASASCNLEIELVSGERGGRGGQVVESWRTLTGCEDAFAVNNNAAATLLVLAAHCAGHEVVVSRGQLVEIGGSFRLPEIFELGGVVLREVGTTNRTRTADYESAIGPNTAAILRVHPSNYRIDGFSEMPAIDELVPVARAHGLLCIDDIGSGCLVDTTRLGLPAEPTFQRSLAAGADLVLGSGDKLLGGPQAGIVLGRSDAVEPLRGHPFARTVRIDKLTLAALSGTLDSYLSGTEFEELPTLELLGTPIADLKARAAAIVERVADALGAGWDVAVHEEQAVVGGGALPGARLPTAMVSLANPDCGADDVARALRTGESPVLPRIHDGRVILDLRSVRATNDELVVEAIEELGSRS